MQKNGFFVCSACCVLHISYNTNDMILRCFPAYHGRITSLWGGGGLFAAGLLRRCKPRRGAHGYPHNDLERFRTATKEAMQIHDTVPNITTQHSSTMQYYTAVLRSTTYHTTLYPSIASPAQRTSLYKQCSEAQTSTGRRVYPVTKRSAAQDKTAPTRQP